MSESTVIFLVGQFIVLLGAIIRIYTQQQVKNKEFEMELTLIKQKDDELYKMLTQLGNNMDRRFEGLSEDIMEIKLELKDKQNK